MTQDRLLSRQQGASLWVVLVLLVIIAAVAAGGWWGWQQLSGLYAEKTTLEQQVADLRQGQARQQQNLQASLADLQQKQQNLQSRIDSDQSALADLKSGGQRLWLINEARALASLASQRLLLTQDAAASRRLLKAADGVLARLDDPRALPARQALAADMEKLSGATRVDVQAMVLRLGALRQLATELAVPASPTPPERNLDDSKDKSLWQGLLERLPVQVRHYDGKVPLPLNDAQAAQVRLTLDGSLQQAQLALMQGRGKAYQQALDSTRATLKQWFRADDPRVAQMLAALDELGGQTVEQALPDIGAGLTAIEVLKRKEAGQ
ncbi:uroporphyrin-III C-methyltransferase [Alcanivorax hongdengensis A-11-3]|uniref:Uroporphyrin-III C-methyltransferase n=1 Tax=Alcanivorax hongdengensis A-11-3 TaxID=1177179 RepID=L0WEM1_9GAMM|nr:uroporphyrinogen-III C-methyltransferase [Alcanivorax hongdengensis]EKF75456.1 uroporphyrin-III C-methyltransferase [Alcanivorax hongdengensis A-11-3]